MFGFMLALALALPKREPTVTISYLALLKSMSRLALTTPVLQQRALYQACLFGAFSLFWTTVPLLLTGSAFHMSQGQVALFALVGGAGAIAAPLAGRAPDRGWSQPATAFPILCVSVAVLITRLAARGSSHAVARLLAGSNQFAR